MKLTKTYIVDEDANELDGWTRETLAAALEKPLNELGIEVVSTPNVNGGGGLVDCDDIGFSSQVESVVEKIIQG